MGAQVWQDFFQNFEVDMDQNLQNSTKLAQITKILEIITFQDQNLKNLFSKKNAFINAFAKNLWRRCGCAFIHDFSITQRDKQRRLVKKSEFLNAFLKDVFRGAMRLRPSPRRPDQHQPRTVCP